MRKLLIVESPTKARTIEKMLGKDYMIVASMGHIRDLPEHELGVDIENKFAPRYVDTARSRSVVKQLRDSAARADEIYLAPDPDREGEAIAWHIYEVLKNKAKAPFYRVTFHEITRSAIEQALTNRGEINLNLVDAQQARRVLDRIVGYQVSPLLWSNLKKGSSAGRVQSAALRLVVEREREIAAFVPREYWTFAILFGADPGNFKGRLFKIDRKEFVIPDAAAAEALESSVRNGSAPRIVSITAQERRRNPQPPFTTSTLQQSANTVLHYTATNTMRYAQQLYEGVELGNGPVGLITYMRTDSVTVAREAQIAAANFIGTHYGKEYVPEKFNYYRNKAAAQEAHEAIRPTDVTRTPELVAQFLDPMQLKLYTLIWKRFVASQMNSARQQLTTVDVEIKGADNRSFDFRSTATVTVFPGFTKLWDDGEKSKEEKENAAVLGQLREGDSPVIRKFDKEQKFTEPPPRYSEAALIKALEENGIGRPSTYATILRTIQDRDYVKRDQGKLVPEELGFQVNDFLTDKLPLLFDIGFTAQMETKLDEIEEGKLPWIKMMTDFYRQFVPWLTAAKVRPQMPEEICVSLLQCFENVVFDPAKKIGNRSYDDKRFFNSVKKAFDENHSISDRQFQALLGMAKRYRKQLDDALIASLPQEYREIIEAPEEESSAAVADPGLTPLFAALDKVEFPKPEGKGKRVFDERKFFTSLKQQHEAGKALSEKQTAVLKRMAEKYIAQLKDEPTVQEFLDSKAAELLQGAVAKEENAPDSGSGNAGELLRELEQVTEWAAPVKRGRFTYDDKKFFTSVKKQFDEGKVLSPKQLAALEKLAERYRKKEDQ
ncbi:MAG: type I DNA topoisomerase [Lentisphaeria bacterium]|nr:type I DNA topoisomerase [Lentisphaeria bacterium]